MLQLPTKTVLATWDSQQPKSIYAQCSKKIKHRKHRMWIWPFLTFLIGTQMANIWSQSEWKWSNFQLGKVIKLMVQNSMINEPTPNSGNNVKIQLITIKKRKLSIMKKRNTLSIKIFVTFQEIVTIMTLSECSGPVILHKHLHHQPLPPGDTWCYGVRAQHTWSVYPILQSRIIW